MMWVQHVAIILNLNKKVVFENVFSHQDLLRSGRIKKKSTNGRKGALKCDFLIKELKRLGIEKNDNFAWHH